MSSFGEVMSYYAPKIGELISHGIVQFDDAVEYAVNANNAEVLYYILYHFVSTMRRKRTPKYESVKDKLLATHDAVWIYNLAKLYESRKFLGSRDTREFARAMIKEPDSKVRYNREFQEWKAITRYAIEIPFAPIDILTDAVISLDNAYGVYHFAYEIIKADKALEEEIERIERLNDYILKNPQYKQDQYEVPEDTIEGLSNRDLEKLTDAICQSKDAKIIYEFASDIKDADKEKLSLAMAETHDQEYLLRFASRIGGNRKVLAKGYAESLYMQKEKNFYMCHFFRLVNVFPLDDFIQLGYDDEIFQLAIYLIDEDLIKRTIEYFKSKGYDNLIYSLAFYNEHIKDYLLAHYSAEYPDVIKRVEQKRLDKLKEDAEKATQTSEKEMIEKGTYVINQLSEDGLKKVLFELLDRGDFDRIYANRAYFKPFFTIDQEAPEKSEASRELKK